MPLILFADQSNVKDQGESVSSLYLGVPNWSKQCFACDEGSLMTLQPASLSLHRIPHRPKHRRGYGRSRRTIGPGLDVAQARSMLGLLKCRITPTTARCAADGPLRASEASPRPEAAAITILAGLARNASSREKCMEKRCFVSSWTSEGNQQWATPVPRARSEAESALWVTRSAQFGRAEPEPRGRRSSARRDVSPLLEQHRYYFHLWPNINSVTSRRSECIKNHLWFFTLFWRH